MMALFSETAPAISVVVPVYKEEDNIRPFVQRMERVFAQMQISYEIIFCLDPSPDRTEEVIQDEINRNSNIRLMVFSRRFGQPAATMAGILQCHGQACVVIDVDLQDPPELIGELYRTLNTGYEVVYAKRRTRTGETLAKKFVSKVGYYLINKFSDVRIPRDTGDFRIISRRVIEQLRQLNESHGFLRGLVAFVGYKQTHVIYDRDERAAGQGKYNRFLGSLKIGFNGLVGYSNFMLSLSLYFGFAISLVALFLIVAIFVSKFVIGREYPVGTPTIITLVLFMGGVQLLTIGILGEYIGRIYDEVKRRPMYIIDRKVNFTAQSTKAIHGVNDEVTFN